jgi:hypothetical protein
VQESTFNSVRFLNRDMARWRGGKYFSTDDRFAICNRASRIDAGSRAANG